MKKNLLLTVLIFSCALTSFAQWEEFYEVTDNNLYFIELAPNGKLLFGAERADVFIENDNNDFDIIDLQMYGFASAADFENDQIGYIGGGCYYVFDECLPNTIHRTLDGGQTWSRVLQHENTGVFNSVEVLGQGKILALSDYNGMVYSSDGGDSWASKEINTDVESTHHSNMKFLNEQTGFIVGGGYNVSTGHYRVLYKTTNGADTWEAIYNIPQSSFHDYFFINSSLGYVLHTNGQVAKTTNGGQSWTFSNYTSNTDEVGMKITFVTANIGYLISNDNIANKGYIYKTTDGGTTWEIDFETEGSLTDFTFSDSENGYVIAQFRKVFKRSGTAQPLNILTEINIAPNPVQDQLQLTFDDLDLGDYQLTIYNSIGQNVMTTNDIYAPISVAKLMSGVYFIEVRNGAELVAKGKFLKEQ